MQVLTQVLLFIMVFTNAVTILFFALLYTVRTIREKKAHRTYSDSHKEDLRFSL